jgi:glycogen operon protein
MLATLLFSQGTPMLLAGDELGHSQGGNNNAYAQDNETTWIDWSAPEEEKEFLVAVRHLIRLRRENPQLRMPEYVHEAHAGHAADRRFEWFDQHATPLVGDGWINRQVFSVVVADGNGAYMLAINADDQAAFLRLPPSVTSWQLQFSSWNTLPEDAIDNEIELGPLSLAIFSAH